MIFIDHRQINCEYAVPLIRYENKIRNRCIANFFRQNSLKI